MTTLEKIKGNAFFKSLNIEPDFILDQLTKTISRRYIIGFVEYLIKNNITFSLSVLDIDNFKNFNDTMGHQIGDIVLKNVSKRIMDSVDDNTFVGRYGGDEFLIVCLYNDTYEGRHDMHKKIFTAIREPMKLDGEVYYITTSCGSSCFPIDSSNYDDLFKKADVTLYRAKSKGRNCYVLYVYEKHKDLTIVKNESFLDRMKKLNAQFDGRRELYHEIYEALSMLTTFVGVEGAALFEVNSTPLLYKGTFASEVKPIPQDILDENFKEGIFTVDERRTLNHESNLYKFLMQGEISSLCAIELRCNGKYLGYLMLFNSHIRVWQEAEVNIAYFLASIISDKLDMTKK